MDTSLAVQDGVDTPHCIQHSHPIAQHTGVAVPSIHTGTPTDPHPGVAAASIQTGIPTAPHTGVAAVSIQTSIPTAPHPGVAATSQQPGSPPAQPVGQEDLGQHIYPGLHSLHPATEQGAAVRGTVGGHTDQVHQASGSGVLRGLSLPEANLPPTQAAAFVAQGSHQGPLTLTQSATPASPAEQAGLCLTEANLRRQQLTEALAAGAGAHQDHPAPKQLQQAASTSASSSSSSSSSGSSIDYSRVPTVAMTTTAGAVWNGMSGPAFTLMMNEVCGQWESTLAKQKPKDQELTHLLHLLTCRVERSTGAFLFITNFVKASKQDLTEVAQGFMPIRLPNTEQQAVIEGILGKVMDARDMDRLLGELDQHMPPATAWEDLSPHSPRAEAAARAAEPYSKKEPATLPDPITCESLTPLRVYLRKFQGVLRFTYGRLGPTQERLIVQAWRQNEGEPALNYLNRTQHQFGSIQGGRIPEDAAVRRAVAGLRDGSKLKALLLEEQDKPQHTANFMTFRAVCARATSLLELMLAQREADLLVGTVTDTPRGSASWESHLDGSVGQRPSRVAAVQASDVEPPTKLESLLEALLLQRQSDRRPAQEGHRSFAKGGGMPQ